MTPRTSWAAAALLAALATAGCGPSPRPGPEPPLAVADWKALPADRKYAAETLERVRAGDPKFAADGAWDEFLKSTVAPARKKDLPKK